ncbi:hypothetical protein SK224_05555 [Microbacterium sp. BG28]|uniref:hypothetical protein n=1 Tax=Microbacterium sp. BG28 TaxID=3097356 RepID=UPI002A5993E8|nr:hypothetical protein [Microbacterium sp. BG28]MDY0828590.1 hypothetical protein [Microbacterium sp. BG28]
MTTSLQNEADELNRIQDFDLDAWLDDIEPPQRSVTVNTRGDILATYGQLEYERNQVLQSLIALSKSLPDDETPDPAATLADDGNDAARERFAEAQAKVADIDERMAALSDTYARNKATFTLKAIDPSERARITAKHGDHKTKVGAELPDEMLKLFLASVVDITIMRDGHEVKQRPADWTAPRLAKFMAKIGDGQTGLLWQAYFGTAMQDVTPPFSPESSSGGATSTF